MACLTPTQILKSIDATINSFLGYFASIDTSLRALLAVQATLRVSQDMRDTMDGWSRLKAGKSWFYEKTVTYTGAANTQDISFPVSIQLNRVEQIWDDDTAKDFSVRIGNASMSAYIELDTKTSNIATSRILQLGTEYKFPSSSRLRVYSGTNTDTKIVTIRVQVDEL